MTTIARRQAKTEPADEAIAFTLDVPEVRAVFDLTREIAELNAATGLMMWDQQTQMAMGSNVVRGPQQAAMSAIVHERESAPALGHAVERAEKALASAPERFTDADRALLRVARRDFDHAARLTTAFVRDLAEARSVAWQAWMTAKAAKDFAQFADPLARMVDLAREHARLLNPKAEPYAVLFDLFEPGMSLDDCAAALRRLREVTVPLLKRVRQAKPIDDAPMHGDFPGDRAIRLSHQLLEIIGYEFDRGRLDLSAHPFTISLGSPYDVRLTTRLDRHNVTRALLPAMHEGGHALYELGIDPALARTSLAHGTSLGLHESQSRFWENIIGRAEPFWQAHYRHLQRTFPKPFRAIAVGDFVRMLNGVRPGFIRVEADELTYNLHIIIRFEIEQDLIAGTLAIKDLPGVWNQKYHDYLGVDPTDDAVGVLQDIHWSNGQIGYFATYSLGNLYAAQIAAAARRAFPDMDERLAKGETAFMREWLRRNVHRWGKVWTATEICRRVTGEPLNPDHFAAYVTNKFTRLYGLKAG
jgi:carboxypeptidase Taq